MKHIRKIFAIVITIVLITSCSLIPAFAAESDASYKASLISQGFPDFYAEKLLQIHKKHPNWTFKPYMTNIDWDTAVANESVERKNLVYINPKGSSATRLYRSMSVGSYVAKSGFDYDYVVRDGSDAEQRGWIDATPMAVAYYMNPYTFIGNDITILQYESLEWNFSSVDEAEVAVEKMLTNTFMSKTHNSNSDFTEYITNSKGVKRSYITSNGYAQYINTSGATVSLQTTYARIICDAAKANNINPCYLTSKILGEVGTGGSGSTTGIYSSAHMGYYNYLNIGATDSGSGNAINNGLGYAKYQNPPWNSPKAAIEGGTKIIAQTYIAKGQNTPYFQKFNVTPTNTYNHQYMTAVNGVVNTTYNTYKGYANSGVLDSSKTFYIPVFNNMPNGTGTSVTFSGFSTTGKTTAGVNMRDEPSLAGKQITTVAGGTSVTVLGGFRCARVAYDGAISDSISYRMYNPLWYKVRLANGTTGYICEDYLNVDASLEIKPKDKYQLSYSIAGSSTEKPRFFSQDTRIATVDANGQITGVSNGTTKVVAYLADGEFSVVNVKVNPNASSTPTPAPAPVPNVTDSAYTVKYDDETGKWYAYKNDEIDWNYTGIAPNEYGWWRIVNGKVDFSATGVYQNENGWWYCRGGEVQFNYTGIKNNAYGWWRIVNGKVDFSATGVYQNENGWWYCKGGQVQFDFTGIASNSNGRWYLSGGKVDFSKNGKITYQGKTYTIRNGKVV